MVYFKIDFEEMLVVGVCFDSKLLNFNFVWKYCDNEVFDFIVIIINLSSSWSWLLFNYMIYSVENFGFVVGIFIIVSIYMIFFNCIDMYLLFYWINCFWVVIIVLYFLNIFIVFYCLCI